ncbi:MAG: hypothetical protein AMJ53_05965 [Gammaproteobacteria bacterium SG8_11]|nr:MAG: hypothetical protein AMJ53_05965 [Gammaproteobacteria bacterium SG8_11]
MIEPLDLSLRFIEHHPGDAAKILETLPPYRTSELLLAIDDTFAVQVVTHLAADYAAACMALMPLDKKRQVFRQLDIQTSVDIFRYLNAKEKYRLLNQLPFSKRLAIQTVNNYSQYSVGAWMSTDYVFVREDKTVEEVIEYIQGSELQNQDYVYVVNSKRQLVSTIQTSQLLKASLKAHISAIRSISIYDLFARANIQDIAEHEAWKHFKILPVVEHDKRLVGALSYKDLMTALDKSRFEFNAQTANIGGEALNLFWALFNNFIELLNDMYSILLRKN